MKNIQKIVVCFALSFCSSWLTNAQSSDQNWVKTTTYKGAGATNPVNEVTYFDGLGRPIQKNTQGQSNSGKDIITHIEYDAYGRQVKDYLPFPSQQNTSLFVDPTTLPTSIQGYYQGIYGDANPFSEKQVEASPLDRVLKQAAPGTAWAMNGGHEIKFDYQTNTSNDNVKSFSVSTTWSASKLLYDINIIANGIYADNQLYKNITKDENWTSGVNNTTEEFKDKEGHVVLKRTYNSGVAHDTYYIYDDFGNLTYVIPPLANGAFDQNTLDGLCYQYKYDNRNRLAAKKLPGKQWEYIVYDKLDHIVATGPVFSPYGDGAVGVMVTQYDILGRVTQTGWLAQTVNETNRGSWQTTINGGSNPFVLATNDILTKNYYDTYTYPNAPNIPSAVEGQPVTTAVKGLATGSWVRILNNANTIVGETSYTLYDSKYRPIRTNTVNYLGGFTQVDSKLDFIGKALYTITTHKRTSADFLITVRDNFTYSAQERLVKHTQQVDGGAEQLIASNTYDELGQLIAKNVGGIDVTGNTGLQRVDYSYNIRGWLKSINDISSLSQTSQPNDLFSFQIRYNNSDFGGNLYNGNISETYWRTSTDNTLRKYIYIYDSLNRLNYSYYQKPELNVTQGNYDEYINYDKNGNITSLNRNGELDSNGMMGWNRIDNLSYTYDPIKKNQLMKVMDNTNIHQGFNDDSDGINDPNDDYAYDANGNMIKDENKAITSISYNHLNLPVKIVINGQEITYLYDATGKKVHKIAPEYVGGIVGMQNQVTDYMQGGFQYKNNILLFFPQAEGYVNVAVVETNCTTCKPAQIIRSNNYTYVYNYTDHLGNIRLSYSLDPSTNTLKVMDENHYYPFGLKHNNYNSDTKMVMKSGTTSKIAVPPVEVKPFYNYKYNGKELQDELGLNMYDYGARNYDPALGRWMNMDAMSEKFFGASNYTYVLNSPLVFIDPDVNEIKFSFIGMNKEESAAARGYLEQIFNKGFDGFATASIDEKGNLTINKTDKEGLDSEENSGTKTFLDTMIAVDEHKDKTNIGVKGQDGNITMGDFDSGVIDLDDIKKVGKMSNNSGEKNAISSHGKLGHEIFEQYLKQVKNITDYDKTPNGAHIQAYGFEDKVNGSHRIEENGLKVNRQNPNFAEANFSYQINGTIVNIKYSYDGSGGKGLNIFSVSQTKK